MSTGSWGDLGATTYRDQDLDATAELIGSGAITLFAIEVDNTANTSAAYVKMWNNASPTVGTTAPDVVLKVEASTKRLFVLNGSAGIAFSTRLAVACVTTSGDGGTTSPTNNVTADLRTN